LIVDWCTKDQPEQMIPQTVLNPALNDFMPVLFKAQNAEALLAIGTLSSIETAKSVLESTFSDLFMTSARIIENLVRAVNWSKEHGIAAMVNKVLDSEHCSVSKQVEDSFSGSSEDIQIPEPEMLCFCLHSLMDLLTACGDKVKQVVESSVIIGSDATVPENIETATHLVGMLLRVLTTEAVHKDSLTSAAILICSLVPYSHPNPQAVALQLAALASCIDEEEISEWDQLWVDRRPLLTMGSVAGRFALRPGSLAPFARQALVRAVLCTRSRTVVTLRLTHRGGVGRGGDSLLFMRAYARICDAVEAAGDLFVVCYALQTLSSCLDSAVAALRSALAGEAAWEVPAGVVEHMFERGVGAVWGHCEDPFQGIADQTKEAFPRLMLLRELGEVSPGRMLAVYRGPGRWCSCGQVSRGPMEMAGAE
jgi:hypothetical protein